MHCTKNCEELKKNFRSNLAINCDAKKKNGSQWFGWEKNVKQYASVKCTPSTKQNRILFQNIFVFASEFLKVAFCRKFDATQKMSWQNICLYNQVISWDIYETLK